jgi:hypothetical protein
MITWTKTDARGLISEIRADLRRAEEAIADGDTARMQDAMRAVACKAGTLRNSELYQRTIFGASGIEIKARS